MFLNKPVVKSYARKVKRKVVLPKNLKLVDFDLTSNGSIEGCDRANSIAKKTVKKTKRNSASRKHKRRCSVVSKPKGLKHVTPKATQIEPRYSSIFNDSFSFEESPFSKIAKTARKDMGLKFVGLDNYLLSLREMKSHNTSSGCLSNSRELSVKKLSISKEASSFSCSKKSGLPATPDIMVKVVPQTVTVRKKIVNAPFLSTVNDSVACSSSRKNENVCEKSPDIIEGTPTPPSLFSYKVWGKAFRRRRQATLFTSTPLRRTNLSSVKSQEATSSVNSECSIIASDQLKDIIRLSLSSRTTSSTSSEGKEKSNLEEKSQSTSVPPFDSFLCSAKEAVFQVCRQISDVNFSTYISERSPVVLEKIGEGVFSEVFGCLDNEGTRSVWKVQPFDGDLIFNGEEQKKSADILSEILITSSLSDLRRGEKLMTECFVKALDFKCVHCPFPKVLLDCWKEYYDKKGSENDCPSVFPDAQLMLVTELEYAGIALEDFVFASAPQALSVFTQVAYALAVAEITLEFEHRDLHWGNIMVFKTPAQSVSYIMDEQQITLSTRGVVAKIVDFTLSRATIDGRFHYADLAASPEIFESTGEYQFEIYRLMRKHTNNEWGSFTPYTNVLWLHYLILQMCKAVKYKNKKAQIHKKYMKTMVAIASHILDFSSALEYVSVQEYYS